MVVIVAQVQKNWWKPWTRRTLTFKGENFEQAYINLKNNPANALELPFINRLEIYTVE